MSTANTLFISHGSPTFALETPQTSVSAAYLRDWAANNPVPDGIVMVSPHWHTRGLAVSSAPRLATVHDFGGFAPELYALQYPAQGSPDLAATVQARFVAAGTACVFDAQQGLDHGAWVPLMKLYPQANVPVVQLSLPARQTPQTYYAIGQVLAGLQASNVLIIGSGSMTHNLYEVRLQGGESFAPYVLPFRHWLQEKIAARDLEALFNYRTLAPYAEKNHPTDEHLMPLFVAMGAAQFGPSSAPAAYIAGELVYYNLAMDHVAFG